jgi:hypothetical protein
VGQFTVSKWANSEYRNQLIEETKKGNEIAAINEDRKVYRVFVTPVLEKIAKKCRREPSPVMAGR